MGECWYNLTFERFGDRFGADVEAQIKLLVESSRAEAQGAIDAAVGGKQKFIDAAVAKMAKGDKKAAQGKPDKAIALYRQAWDKAQKAVK